MDTATIASLGTLRPCSGQSRTHGPRSWSVCSDVDPCWRPEDARGRVLLFASMEGAQKWIDRNTVPPA